MRKGEKTREFIVQQAAELFNQQGYFGSSMSDIMRVTGLRKGGIYNHFESKDELALEAFDYAIGVLSRRYYEAIRGKSSAAEQLISVVSIYENVIENPPLKGGCPLLNTAVESDDAHPVLREKAADAMDQFLKFIQMIINRGIRKGELKASIHPESAAIFITSAMEGAVMMSKLYRDSRYMQQALEHLSSYIHSLQKSSD
ncbi:TetR family transcriptional regulator [Paenibacillus campinasensis]|uniref:TetR family transcriptional regulator n=1 Tax=Paenibacillus campinasensis TaxID=66347 RepID=A0ABW9T7B8_9BACL|nr:TetR/AcrR family transcriptional regulator [Paenibacillus campinasensis]MUG68547.1 TetR family transcriptional regulator [Paenibacillus campinasensis]